VIISRHGFFAEHTEVVLVVITTRDPPRADREADALVALVPSPPWLNVIAVAGIPGEAPCTTGDGTAVAPAPALATLVDTVRATHGRGSFESLCAPDWVEVVARATLGPLASTAPATCFPRSLERNDDGLVACTLVEHAPPDAPWRCADLPGREPSPRGENTCVITQVSDIDTPGWLYDDTSESALNRCFPGRARLVFTGGVQPTEGSTISLSCLQAESSECTP
jgi:hypothetical protein